MKPVETIETTKDPVGCDGGGDAAGHPLVYLPLDAEGKAVCPYCSRVFTLKAGVRTGGHGH